jgi:nuclear transcription Y subunit beta
MSTLGFDNYVEPLKLYLQKYREAMKGEKQPEDAFEEMDDVLSKLFSEKIENLSGW